ncbi:MAG: EAL domain-containing protein [Planctomycetes bacterium]|nr:EAL domain-containing protein [Planctomycetota bacterium]
MRAGVIITDSDGKFRVFNAAAERIMGIGAKDVGPDQWADTYGVFHPDRTTPYVVHEYPLMRALQGAVVDNEEMFIRNHSVPTGIPISVSAAPIHDQDGAIIGGVATIYDISPVKHVEGRLDEVGRQLVLAQKLEAVGRLASGVAHDFNNQLSVILSFTQMALDQVPEDSEAAADLRSVVQAANRAATLTRQLLAMSRRSVSTPRVVVADEVVSEVEKVLRRIIGEDVKLHVKLDSNQACVSMDPTQFEQILMNLVVNARDAMPSGGLITITSEIAELDQTYAAGHHEVKPGPYYCLTVTDTGHGMDAETLSRLYEPFFTTKPEGRGTGLGMAIVHGLVKQSNGVILVYSEPGEGTSFKLYFPCLDAEATRTIQKPGEVSVDGRGRTVLLVEDDAQVRAVASRILKREGFEVLEASNAQEAREIGIAADRPIEVLLSDVVMPGVSGPELAVQLSRMIPGMRVVLMSGYPAEALLNRKTDLAKAKLISKPFSPAELLRAVAAVLAPRQDTGSVDKSLGHVLVVDDDESVRKLVRRMMETRGYTVVDAESVQAGMDQFTDGPVDVVVSDINLPDGQGLDLLKQIRQRDMDVPVILMTGAPDLEMATEAIRYGAFRFVAKPIPQDELLQMVSYAVRMGRLSRLKREALNLTGKDGKRPRDPAGLEICFEAALDRLWVEFQPIMRTGEHTAYAYEVLARNDEPTLRSPAALFAAARELDRLKELGRLIRRKAAEAIGNAPPGALLFVNLVAQDLDDSHLFDPDAPLSRIAERVVLELTEREALEPGQELEAKIHALRQLGFRIAVDDLGAGYSGLATFAQLSPEIVKLDMSLVRDIDKNLAKRKTVTAMIELCQGLGIKVVAEGIETSAERECLMRLGCDFLQGYFFSRPSKEFVTELG